MHMVSKRLLREFWQESKDAEIPLINWFRLANKAVWQSLAEVRESFPHPDLVGTCTVFNIGGNKYRLITYINYRIQKVYALHVLTHLMWLFPISNRFFSKTD